MATEATEVDINEGETEQVRLYLEPEETGNDQEKMGCQDSCKERAAKGAASCHEALCGEESPVVKYAKDFCSVKNVKRKFPIVKWLPEYRLKHFIGDLVAGLTVGLTVIPQGIAYAGVANLPPQYGLYSAFMGCFIYCFFGTSKDITLGPTAIMSLLVAKFASEKAPENYAATYAIVLTLISGLMQLVMGFLHLGFVVQFISAPVISGFTSAAAILIAFSQVKKWLGLAVTEKEFIPSVEQTFQLIPQTNLWDLGLGLGCMVVLTLMKKLKDFVDPKMKIEKNKTKKALFKLIWLICTARNAVVVIITAGFASILVDIYNIRGEGTLTLTGNIVAGIPVPAVPALRINHFNNHTNETITKTAMEIIGDIGEGFFIVTLIGMLEAIAIGKAFARRNSYKIDNNQELIAMGASNIFSSFFHSYPVTGSFSRTAINSQSGVRTPAGGIWTGLIVLLALGVLTPYFYYIPKSALAAVIICAVLQMVDYEILPKLWRVKKLDLIPLLLTFLISVLTHLEYGIAAGVGFSLLILIYPMARPGLTITYEKSPHVTETGEDGEKTMEMKEAVIIEPNQGLKFPGIEYIKDKVMKHGAYEIPAKAVILNAQHFAGCDYSMVLGVTQLTEYFRSHKLQFILAACSPEVRGILEAAKIKHLKFAENTSDALQQIFADDSLANSQLGLCEQEEEGKINVAYAGEEGSSTNGSDDVVIDMQDKL